jgi:hypothetical protein
MTMRFVLRVLGSGIFALPILVLGLSLFAVASTVEARSCPDCDPIELNCDGSTCHCTYTFGGYKCLPE